MGATDGLSVDSLLGEQLDNRAERLEDSQPSETVAVVAGQVDWARKRHR